MGVGELIDMAFKIYQRNWKTLMLVVAVVEIPLQLLQAVVASTSGVSERPFQTTTINGHVFVSQPGLSSAALTTSIVLALVQFFFVAPLLAGAMAWVTYQLYAGKKPTAAEVLRFGLSRLLSILLVSVLVGLAVFGGLLLLIVPGIIFAIRFTVAVPALVVEDVRGREAMRRSWRLVKDYSGRVFGISLLAALIAGIVTGIFTAPFAITTINSPGGFHFWTFFGGTVAAIVTRPFTALVTTLIYFDLRVRKEGFDLAVMAQRMGATAR